MPDHPWHARPVLSPTVDTAKWTGPDRTGRRGRPAGWLAGCDTRSSFLTLVEWVYTSTRWCRGCPPPPNDVPGLTDGAGLRYWTSKQGNTLRRVGRSVVATHDARVAARARFRVVPESRTIRRALGLLDTIRRTGGNRHHGASQPHRATQVLYDAFFPSGGFVIN
jgi:hypothetical protein